MTTPTGPFINVGSGPDNPPPWINIDGSWQARLAGHRWLARAGSRLLGIQIGHWPAGVRYHDVRRGLAFQDHTVAVVYASHLLEHLHRDEALALLREARRALIPGGICRIVVPDVEAIVGWYLAHQREAVETHREPSSDLLMGMLQLRPKTGRTAPGLVSRVRRLANLHEHKWMYDREGLLAIFREAGFVNPSAREFLDSAIPREALERVERADRVCNGAGVCVEARS
jgi:SAM-dependent methyltransferase